MVFVGSGHMLRSNDAGSPPSGLLTGGRLTLLVTAALFASVASAETLTLEQAVERALKHDSRIQEKQHMVDHARGLHQEAKGANKLMFDANTFIGLAPTVSGGMFKDGTTGTDGLNASTRSDGYDLNGITPWYNLQFSVIKPLKTFGKIENYTVAAEENIKVVEGDLSMQRAEIVYDVYRAYYGYLTARDTRLLLEDVKKRLDGATELVQGWLERGRGTTKQADLFALQTGTALVNGYIAEAGSLEQIALDGLRTLTGVGLGNALKVADKNVAPLELPKGNLKKFIGKALTSRPEMKQLEAGLNARRALVEAARAESRPNLYAGVAGGLAYTPGRDSLDNPYIYDPFNWYAATPIVGLQWTWNSGRQPAKVVQAEAELNALVATNTFAREGIPYQVAEQYATVQASHTKVEELAQASRAGRRWMIASYADFEAGLEEADKVVTAFQAYVLAHSDYLQAVYQYNLSVAKLKQVTGEIQ